MLQRLAGCVGESSVAIVDVDDIVGNAVVGDVDVGPAIPIQIGDDDAESIARIAENARGARHVGELLRFSVGALAAIQLVVAPRCISAQARRMTGDAAREIPG